MVSCQRIHWKTLTIHQDKIFKNANGLICGCSGDYQPHNIFALSNFQYMSNNNSCLKGYGLPFIKCDIIEMSCDNNTKSKAANDDNTKNNPIFATSEEKSTMNDIIKLKKILNDNSIQRENVQSMNKNVILSSIKKLKNCLPCMEFQ